MPDDHPRELPYEGTVQDFRIQTARDAQRGVEAYSRLFGSIRDERDGPLSPEDTERHLLAISAANYGWAVVGLLGWIGAEFGTEVQWRAAAVAQDIGINGGNKWCEDIPWPLPEPAPVAAEEVPTP